MYMYILVTHNLEVDIRAVFIQTTQRAAVTSFLSKTESRGGCSGDLVLCTYRRAGHIAVQVGKLSTEVPLDIQCS